MFSKYLSHVDRASEVAFAVLMVIIINGYVALSDLNTGFMYIVTVNLGACLAWGTIDGLIYAISSSMKRNNLRSTLLRLKSSLKSDDILQGIKGSLDETFLAGFDGKGKEAIAREIAAHIPNISLQKSRVLTREEVMGWLSIIGIYLLVGTLLALPFLILPDKVLAWLISNAAGVAWLFGYGMQLGRSAGKNRWLLGSVMALVSILFLAASYLGWAA